MNPNNEKDALGLPAQWITHAESDLRLGRLGADDSAVLREQVCFHAQQAAEKALKAVLLSREIEFPWTDLVNLHPDVEAGALTEAVFAIDLGAIAANDSNVPVVNRDPEAFFRATYLTGDLRKLLDEVLA